MRCCGLLKVSALTVWHFFSLSRNRVAPRLHAVFAFVAPVRQRSASSRWQDISCSRQHPCRCGAADIVRLPKRVAAPCVRVPDCVWRWRCPARKRSLRHQM